MDQELLSCIRGAVADIAHRFRVTRQTASWNLSKVKTMTDKRILAGR